MVSTSTMRSWWSGYRCLPGTSLERDITMFGRDAGTCALNAYDGFIALEKTLIATGYTGVKSVWIPRACPSGIGGSTCTSTGAGCSLHNYGIAVDIDPFGYGNPYFKKAYGNGWNFSNCKFTRPQVEAVEKIKNVHGEQFFRWLGWAIGDTMHFELQVHPTRTQVNWDTVPGGIGAQMFCSKGDKGPVVAYWQIILKYDLGADLGTWGDGTYGTPAGDGVDGVYGNTMEARVKQFTNKSGAVVSAYEARELQKRAWGGGSNVDLSDYAKKSEVYTTAQSNSRFVNIDEVIKVTRP